MADATAVDTTIERERLSWEQFGEASRDLARTIQSQSLDPVRKSILGATA